MLAERGDGKGKERRDDAASCRASCTANGGDKVETQKDAVNTAAEQATATLTEQATKTEELQQAPALAIRDSLSQLPFHLKRSSSARRESLFRRKCERQHTK